jgi:hypothetical protein
MQSVKSKNQPDPFVTTGEVRGNGVSKIKQIPDALKRGM